MIRHMGLAPQARTAPAAASLSSSNPGFPGGAASLRLREHGDLTMIGPGSSRITDALLERVCGEFLEMPGLRLTCQQARRLWDLDEPTCQEILGFLVDARFLARPERDGVYLRLTDGAARPPRLDGGANAHAVAGSGRIKDIG